MTSTDAAPAAAARRVSTLELFFDLVFVFTITQVATIVEREPSWAAVAQAALELTVIFWMYGGFAWLTNRIGTDAGRQRAVLLLGMAAFLVVSLAVPRAFGDDGVAFGWAYLGLNVVHLVGFVIGDVPAAVRVMVRVGSTNLVAAALVLVAGYAGAPWHWPLWAAAFVVQWVPPLVNRTLGVFTIDAAHFGERHGLMVLIVLGESLVSLAVAADEEAVTAGLAIGVLCGLVTLAAMWWCYFAGDDDRAAEAMAGLPPGRQGVAALVGYDMPHVLMLAGVVGLAAGARLSLPDLTGATSLAAAALLAGGAAVYLAGLAAFRGVLAYGPWPPRAVAAVVAPTAIPVGTAAGAAQELLVLAALMVALLLAERRLAG